MKAEIEKYKTNWYGIILGISSKEIDKLILALKQLKEDQDHFHLRSNFEGDGGIADLEIYFLENEDNSLTIDDSIPIYPNR